jgi:hypothetical protein
VSSPRGLADTSLFIAMETAIALGVPVVTQDDDFEGAPLVEVVRV